ncbi:pectate lyase family protein [Neptunicella sp.]|uniref:pectate lyase family protein n=1 Tax=Neptunicella sp. TaxID=2125986 RepID=UPI003F68C6ED
MKSILQRLISTFLTGLLLMACQSVSAAKQLAFPGAEGFGQYTQGGRGGRIIVVDSLQDSDKALPGTLRYAVKAKGPRIVVFSVSGVIHLVKPLEIKQDFITIAGQTSPAGIVLTGSETQIDASQVIIRYLRFRPGAEHEQGDAITGKRHHDIIIDHCSMSWANDEVASFYNNTNFTLQYSIVSESLNNAGHAKGSHGYGGIWGGQRASFIHNVLAHHTSRNPRINGYRLNAPYQQKDVLTDIRNNVIYNWSKNSAYGSENGRFNMVNNLFKPGPADGPLRFFQLWDVDNKKLAGQAYITGNVMFGHDQLSTNNLLGLEIKDEKHLAKTLVDNIKQKFLVVEAFNDAQFPQDYLREAALDSYQQLIVKREVGANRNRSGPFQDSVDRRVLAEIAAGNATIGNGIIDSELQVIKSWDAYAQEFVATGAGTIPAEYLNDSAGTQQWIDKLGEF